AVVVGHRVGLPALFVALPSLDRGDKAAGEELVAAGDRLIDLAASVSAHVDDQLAIAALPDILERALELLCRPLLKIWDLDVVDAAEFLVAQRERMVVRLLD